jgi:hypothetical protein
MYETKGHNPYSYFPVKDSILLEYKIAKSSLFFPGRKSTFSFSKESLNVNIHYNALSFSYYILDDLSFQEMI